MTQKTYTVTIKRSTRAKRVRLYIRGRNKVEVVAPVSIREKTLQRFVKDKHAWIEKQQRRIPTEIPWVIPEGVTSQDFTLCKARAKKFIRDKVMYWHRYYQYGYNRISVKDMKTQWGSCSTKKNLNFHYRLLFLPEELADYIIIHELCHLKEMNHSKQFWALVAKQAPEYRRLREELKKFALAV